MVLATMPGQLRVTDLHCRSCPLAGPAQRPAFRIVGASCNPRLPRKSGVQSDWLCIPPQMLLQHLLCNPMLTLQRCCCVLALCMTGCSVLLKLGSKPLCSLETGSPHYERRPAWCVLNKLARLQTQIALLQGARAAWLSGQSRRSSRTRRRSLQILSRQVTHCASRHQQQALGALSHCCS